MSEIKESDPSRQYAEEWIQRSDASANIATSDPGNEREKGLASCLYQGCIDMLKLICQSLPNILDDEAFVVADVKGLKEQLGRLFLWGESLSDGSLDKALDQSDELRKTVLTCLHDIAQELLSDDSLHPPSLPIKHPLKQLENDIEPLLDQAQEVIRSASLESGGIKDQIDDDASVVSSVSPSDLEQEDDQRQTLSSRLSPLVDDLADLSPTIESNLNHVPQSKRGVQSNVNAFSVSAPALPYVSIIRDKFPKAASKLVERLGEANWQRHVVVRERMEKGAEKSEATEGGNKAAIFSQHGKVSLFYDSGIGASIPAESQRAASVASHSSFVSTLAEDGQHKARVPSTPREVSQGIPFECNICHSIQSNIRNRVEWKMHVFADLQPYICTFTGCSDELLQFPTRTAWAEHEFDEHRVKYVWKCMQCGEELASPEMWRDHLRHTHKSVLSRAELEAAMTSAFRCRDAPIENEQCHLCQESLGRTRRAIVKHVCRHLEEIALMVLPRGSEDDTDEGSEGASDVADLASEKVNSHAEDPFSILKNQLSGVENELRSSFSNGQEVLCRPPDIPHSDAPLWLGRVSKTRKIAVEGQMTYYIEDVVEEGPFKGYWVSGDSIFPIRTSPTRLGERVLARFPDTTGFWPGRVIGRDPGGYNVTFEGDEGHGPVFVEASYVSRLSQQEDEAPELVQHTIDSKKQFRFPKGLPTEHDEPSEPSQHGGDLHESVFPPTNLRRVATYERKPSNDRGPKCNCGNYTSIGNMVHCQSGNCPHPTSRFHPECVGVTEDTKGQWLCPDCESAKQEKPESEN